MTTDTTGAAAPPYTAENFRTARELLALESVEAIRGFTGTPSNDGQGFAIAAIATAAAQAHATLALCGILGTIGRALDERLLGIAQKVESVADAIPADDRGLGELTTQLGVVAAEIKTGLDDVRRAIPS